MIVHVLDNYYLAITFLISLGLQGTLFLVSFSFQTDKLTDLGTSPLPLPILQHSRGNGTKASGALTGVAGLPFCLTTAGGSANFFLLALFTLLAGNTFYARNIIARSALTPLHSLRRAPHSCGAPPQRLRPRLVRAARWLPLLPCAQNGQGWSV